jgi:hypothetical protein
MSPAEVEAILLHELAHIRRHDYLINLVQRITSIIFFFNPAVLWLSSLIRAERENCCDDIAIKHTHNKLQFVEALMSVKQCSFLSPGLAMKFLGPKNFLLHRINRIVYNRNKSLSVTELFFFVGSLLSAVLFFNTTQWSVPAGPEPLAAIRPVQSQTYLLSLINDNVKEEELRSLPSYHKWPSNFESNLWISAEQKPANRSITQVATNVKEPVIKNIESTRLVNAQPEAGQVEPARETGRLNYSQQENDRATDDLYRLQVEKDREAAERDRIQADKDRAQAELDRQQAALDRIQAEKDRAQAELDRQQAEKDRIQADRDREQAKRDWQIANTKLAPRLN